MKHPSSPAERPVLHLIDGSGYIYRAYYAVRPLATRTGVPTNAVVGFARMLAKLIRQEQPHLLGIAFDMPTPTFRHDMYPQYKANRQRPPDDLLPQFALIHQLVEAMDICVLKSPGFEADDLLATLSHQAIAQAYDVVMVSGDKDLMQLVGQHLIMFDPLKEKHYDIALVQERFGVPPHLVADVLALAGDQSDNIPGVPQVGLKSAAKLVASYGHLEQVISGLSQLAKRRSYEQAVLDHADTARLSKRLVVLHTQAPVNFDPQHLAYSLPNPTKLAAFLQKIDAHTLLREFGLKTNTEPTTPQVAVNSPSNDAPSKPTSVSLPPIDQSQYQTILTEEQLCQWLQQAQAAPYLSVDVETTSLQPTLACLVGISLAAINLPPVYIPIAHNYLGAPKQLPWDTIKKHLQPILEAPTIAKVGQNLKYDSQVLARAGIHMQGIAEDSMLAAYVLNPDRVSFSLDALTREYLNHTNISYSDVVGKGKNRLEFADVPVDVASQYAAEDADMALRLCHLLVPKVSQIGLHKLYQELEMPLLSVLADMESQGILVNVAHLKALAHEFNIRLLDIEQQANALIGTPINLASPKQLAYLFFEKLGYPTIKKTKTGYSTDQEVLETLARDYELPQIILNHRLLAKLKSTYVDSLPKLVHPQTNRLHTSFNQTGTATGRLSSSDPNLQNIPIRTEDGRRIRAAFITQTGWELISADYSQIELRVMAHLCEDEHFLESFRQGEDIHARTAREILGMGQVIVPEMRRRAKAINFGILYGLSEFGLAKQLGINRTQAHLYIANYFARYPRIREFLDHTIEQGRRLGYVSTMIGRRRYLPNLRNQNGTVRQAAERIAINTPIQGSAADLIKLAMLRVTAALKKQKLQARLLLQVHDELLLEAPQAELAHVTALLQHEMTQVMPLKVPLVVDIGHGQNWALAH